MTLAIHGVRLWDGVSDRVSDRPCTIRIEGRRIVAIGEDPRLLEGARVVEPGDGFTALPGLIDAHVHMTLDPATKEAAAQAERSARDVAGEAEVRAGEMVRAGITTARDLGGGAAHLELALRDRIERGAIPGPRLLCAGQPLTSKGGHCHFWGGEVESDEEARAFVRRQHADGVDWIKVMATGGVLTRGTRPRDAQFSRERLTAICDEAHGVSRRVAAHCHATEGIRRATEAGVDTIEHCSWAGEKGFGEDVDEELAGRIGERGIRVSPTVNSGWKRFTGTESEFVSNMRGAFQALRRAGARLIASTDAGIPNVVHHDLPRALPVFAALAGLSPVEVLRAATSDSADALGVEAGRLEPGLDADLMVVPGDPLEDLAALLEPRLVVARGSLHDLAR